MPTLLGYEYRQRLEPSGDWNSLIDVGNVLTDPVTGLTPDTLYGFQNRAYYDDGSRGAWSNIATARTLAEFNGYGPVQWLKADAITGLADGDLLTFWPDSSAFDNDGTGSASAPTYKTNIINSLPAIRFDGTSAAKTIQLTISNSTPSIAAEMMIVLKKDNDPSVDIPRSGSWNFVPAGTTTYSHYPWTDGKIYDAFATTSRKSVGNPAQNLASFHIYNVYSAANDFAAAINGTQIYSTSTNTFLFFANAQLGQSNQVATPIGPTPRMCGYIAEYILWDRKLTTAERAEVLAYLQTKYAL